MKLDEMKLYLAGMDDFHAGKQSYRKLVEWNCSEKECRDIVKQFFKRCMHKEYGSPTLKGWIGQT